MSSLGPYRARPKDYVSTGHLPPSADTQSIVERSHEIFSEIDEGQTFAAYPALARVDPELFGVCVAGVDGDVYQAGDAAAGFTTMSAIKPFTFALVVQAIGAEEVRAKVGLNATGMEFNSVVAIELQANHLSNPMVNAGAMATLSLLPGRTAASKWRRLLEGFDRFAGRSLKINEEVYESVSRSNWRNQAVARLLYGHNRLYFDPIEVTDLYTKQSTLDVTARDLAVMAATLSNGGVNPVSGERVVDSLTCQHTLAVMTTAGMYETSGDWLFDIGTPGKSGIGGGVLAVAPGKGGVGVYSPRLDASGNSVRGQLATRFLSQQLGLNMFASAARQRPGL